MWARVVADGKKEEDLVVGSREYEKAKTLGHVSLQYDNASILVFLL